MCIECEVRSCRIRCRRGVICALPQNFVAFGLVPSDRLKAVEPSDIAALGKGFTIPALKDRFH